MAAETVEKVLTEAMVPGDFAKKYMKFGQIMEQFIKDVRSLHASLVQYNNDIAAKRAELQSLKADCEKAKREKQIHLDAFQTSQKALIDKMTKERLDLDNQKRKLEFLELELNRKAARL